MVMGGGCCAVGDWLGTAAGGDGLQLPGRFALLGRRVGRGQRAGREVKPSGGVEKRDTQGR
jgi:hypothetical protein